MAELDGNTFVELLGLTAEDQRVRALMLSCGISKQPKVKRGDVTDVLTNPELGLEITFRDERHLDVRARDYEEGALVLSNLRMYGGGHKKFRRFAGDLPFSLSFDEKLKEAHAKLGKPTWQNPAKTLARWNRPAYTIFVGTDAARERITEVAVQLPVE